MRKKDYCRRNTRKLLHMRIVLALGAGEVVTYVSFTAELLNLAISCSICLCPPLNVEV